MNVGEILVITEYCCYGNLHDYILQNRYRFVNQIDSDGRKILSQTDKNIENTYNNSIYQYQFKRFVFNLFLSSTSKITIND